MPDIKNLIWMAGIGLVSIVGTLIVTSAFTTAEEGAEALEIQRITIIVEKIIEDKLNVVIDGETVTLAEALTAIHTEQVAVTAAFKQLTAD